MTHTAGPGGGDLKSIDGAKVNGGHADVDGGRPARVAWLMISAIIVLGVVMGYLAARGWLPQAFW